jgi:hypothetical protein
MVPDSCYKFSEDKFTFYTNDPQTSPIVFKPTHLKVEGSVKLKDEK